MKSANPCSITNIDIDRETYIKELSFDRSKYVKYKCLHCDKEFTDNSNRYRHQKSCKFVRPIQSGKDFDETSEEDDSYKDKNRDELIEIIRNIKNNKNVYTNSSNNNSHCTITQTINIHNYGHEDLSKMKNNLIKHFLSINLPKLIRDIHYDPVTPENMNMFYHHEDDKLRKRINDRWVKIQLPDGIHQLIIDKAKLLERVPKSHDLLCVCDEKDIDNSLHQLKKIKEEAIKKEETILFDNVYSRLEKEEQKMIARDTNSEEPYCFIRSNSGSNEDE